MKIVWIFALRCTMIGCILVLIGSTTPAFALTGGMERATVHSMRMVPCMAEVADGDETLALNTSPSLPPLTGDCVEYELHTSKVRYVIHPHHAILLEVGGEVSFKLDGNRLILLTSGGAKEIRCDVLSMTLRSDDENREKEKEWERERQPSRDYPSGCYTESGTEFSCAEDEAYR